MRKQTHFSILSLIVFLLFSISLSAQHLMTNGTVTTCSGAFTDSGGGGEYSNNEDYTYTICSDGTGNFSHISMVFSPMEIEAGDTLCFYDGADTNAPLIACSNTISSTEGFVIRATAANPSGCITITFKSNDTGTANGWSANIGCTKACQTVLSSIANSTPAISPADTGWIDICPGDIVTFQGTGLYPQDGFIYGQSNNTTSFEWDFGDGTVGYGPNVQHQYNNPGGYIVQLKLLDSIGCNNTNFLSQRIRVSGPPTFNLASDIVSSACVGDTIKVKTKTDATGGDIVTNSTVEGFPAGGSVADSVCVPDGTGQVYTSTLELSQFSPGQTLNNISDLLGVCVNMEHSYLGDLEIKITCPGGNTVTLHQFSNQSGGGYSLGQPIDNNSQACEGSQYVGVGADYCWTPNATNGTWLASGGLVVDNQLPPGDYSSYEDLSGLLGCPLNGEWVISIEDLWNIDDGVIFSWNLELNEAIFPDLETFELPIVNQEWGADPTIIINSQDSMVAVPENPGTINYIFEVTDTFGCKYDTTVNISVLPQTDPGCYHCTGNLTAMNDTTICGDLGGAAQLSTQLENVDLTETTFQATPNAPFTNSSNPVNNPLLSTLEVAGLPYSFITANSIQNVCINISHSFSLDVVATLVAPNGTSVELTNGGSNSPGPHYTNTCFTPTATTAISTGTPPYTGEWSPNGDLSTLIGSQANGTWTLQVADKYSTFENGVLMNWSITFSLGNDLTWSWSPATGLSCTDCPNPIASPTTTTTYSVTATDQNNCTFTEDVTVNVINCNIPCNLAATVASTTDVTCNGGADGTANITITGNHGSASYDLNNGAVTQTDNGTFSNLAVGSHQVIITDSNNCKDTVNFVIAEPAVLSVALTPNAVSCYGGMNGSITSAVTGGTTPYTFAWDNSTETTATISNLAANNYTVTVTDANSCTSTQTIAVTQPDSLSVSFTNTDINCFGGNTGSSEVSVSGGIAPYTYTWNDTNAQTTATASNLIAGTYIVTITDANSCSATYSTTINQATELVVDSILQAVVGCEGSNSSQAVVYPSGGTTPYTFNWSNGATAATNINLADGNYIVTITDVNACSVTATVDISSSAALDMTIAVTNVGCYNENTGSATVTVLGGIAPYTYVWNDANAQSTNTATNLAAGAYSVTVTDANNCSSSQTVNIEQPQAALAINTINQILTGCDGSSDNAATLVASGGTAPYSYLWSNNVTHDTITNISEGTYTVTVTDANNCTATSNINISNSPALIADISAISVNCFGGNDGSATATVSGGVSPYTYLWSDSNAQTTNVATNLPAGDYTVTVTDANNCTATYNTTVQQPTVALSIDSINQTSIGCTNSNQGEATVYPTGGTMPYTYIWSNGGTANIATALADGNAAVTITDNNGCSITATVNISSSPAMQSSTSMTAVSCYGGNDGTATVQATGGIPPYSYSWSGTTTQTTATATNLQAGNYTVTVTDANNCTLSQSIEVSTPPALSYTEIIHKITCAGESNGTVGTIPSGGTPPYTYLWDTGGTDSLVTHVGEGNYTVTVTDGNGCTYTHTVSIFDPAVLGLTTNTLPVSCSGGSNGQVSVSAQGGTAPISYQWNDSNNSIDPMVQNLPAGNYTVIVTDNNGCSASETVTVTQPNSPIGITTAKQTIIGCYNLNQNEAEVVATGGTAPYDYDWSSGSNSSTATALTPGTYTVTVTDSRLCSVSTQINVVEYGAMAATAQSTDATCYGGDNGSVNVGTISGGSADGNLSQYAYVWSDGSPNFHTASHLPAGTYGVTITDATGCTATASATVNQPNPMEVNIRSNDLNCTGETIGYVAVSTTGDHPPFTYQWDEDANHSTLDSISNLPAGIYTVTITDANGCTSIKSTTVATITPIDIAIESNPTDCNGNNTGNIQATASGGNAPYTYIWSNGDTTTVAQLDSLAAGDYSVTVLDTKGCSSNTTVSVAAPTEVSLEVETTAVTCHGDTDGIITATASGGTPPYIYSMNDSLTGAIDTWFNLAPNYYQIAVTDANGCNQTLDSVQVEEPTALSLSLIPSDDMFEVNLGDSLLLGAIVENGIGAINYFWNATNNDSTLVSCNNCSYPVVYTYENDVYTVTATDENGCEVTGNIRIKVARNRAVYVPSAFTPNGDSANDVLMVHGKTGTVVESFQVFDRWGERVFEAANFPVNSTEGTFTWDGTFKGQAMNPAQFVWIMTVKYKDERKETLMGETQLLR